MTGPDGPAEGEGTPVDSDLADAVEAAFDDARSELSDDPPRSVQRRQEPAVPGGGPGQGHQAPAQNLTGLCAYRGQDPIALHGTDRRPRARTRQKTVMKLEKGHPATSFRPRPVSPVRVDAPYSHASARA